MNWALRTCAGPALSLRYGRSQGIILVYHEVLPPGDRLPHTSTQITAADFRAQLEYVASACRVLTMDDFLARRTFPDEICRNAYFIDVHHAEADAGKERDPEWIAKRHIGYEPGESHGIPYRCLTPKGLADVLVAGRCISTDRPVQGSTRVMPVCLAMGEAAGMAAAFAAGAPAPDVHAVNVNRLREGLRKHGAYLPE